MQNGAKYLNPISLASLILSSSHSLTHSTFLSLGVDSRIWLTEGGSGQERAAPPAGYALSNLLCSAGGKAQREASRERAALRPARREWSGGAAAACVRRPAMAGKHTPELEPQGIRRW